MGFDPSSAFLNLLLSKLVGSAECPCAPSHKTHVFVPIASETSKKKLAIEQAVFSVSEHEVPH